MQEFRERGWGAGGGQAEGEREGGQQFLEITQGAFRRLVNPLWKSGLSSLLGCFRGKYCFSLQEACYSAQEGENK